MPEGFLIAMCFLGLFSSIVFFGGFLEAIKQHDFMSAFTFILIVILSISPMWIFIKTPLPDYVEGESYKLIQHENSIISIIPNEYDNSMRRVINVNAQFKRNVDPDKFVLKTYISKGKSGLVNWSERVDYRLEEIDGN